MMAPRNNQARRKEIEDLSARRYARRPITTAMFAFIILFSGLILLSALPLSFFFDPSSITSKIRIGDFPIGMIYQPPNANPEIKLPSNITIPDWLRDILINLINNTNPPTNIGNITIPPNLQPINYIGNGPFGANTLILTTPDNPTRYWRIFTCDDYNGSQWNPTNYTTDPFNFGGTFPGADIYQVRINLTLLSRFSLGLPLPTLWNSPEILNNPAFYVTPNPNITWNLIKNEYKDVFLNISNTGLSPIDCEVIYNVTYNPNVNLTYIKQNVKPNPPSQGPSLPGKYLQTPNIPSITPYLQDFLSKMNPISTTNNTYNTVLAALEYFKTRFYYDPVHTTSNADINRFLTNGYGDSKDFATTFTIFLRYLNISTRYIMGGCWLYSHTSLLAPINKSILLDRSMDSK